MFVNSLFSDYIKDNGLKAWKDESTRDIICLEFNYGSRSYRREVEHLHSVATTALKEYQRAKIHNDQYLIAKAYNKRKKITGLLEVAHQNRKRYQELSKAEIRKLFYNQGVDVEYISRGRDGIIKKRETIHYKMLYRSTGKAKKGSCMFIRDRLYKKAHNFLYMGIKLPDVNPMVVEASAYIPLVSSGIVGRIKINPKNILVLKDVDRYFTTNVVSIETDENKHCVAKRIDNYELKNTMFDGQALIDSSIFPEWGNGYILLRHHFCKMAAFNTNIQKFFKDYFGDNYYSAIVQDMFGNTHYVKDIELITTDNAMKWIKFDISYDYWCERVYENNCMFGIVKTAHPSKLGNMQKMSYQMVNSLDESIMENVVKESVEYVNKLKTDTTAFLEYLKKNSNFSNDYEVLIALCEQNPDFVRSSYFRDRKKFIINAYVLGIKGGEIIQNAENLTVIGSPYAMLLYAATGIESSVDDDDTFYSKEGVIQCYTERFNSGDYLAFFRSPFNSRNNLTYLHNTYSSKMEKYFNFGKQIIAINMNGTDAQDRNNGMDQDSDFGYTTNQPDIVAHAKYCYLNHATIVNNIPKETNKYRNTMDDYANIDNGLAETQTIIGESSNLAQIGQTYACNYPDQKYTDYVCILSILAQVAIDSSKRRFNINLVDELKHIKNDIDLKTNKYPNFWLIVKKGFSKENINKDLRCPMNYLYELDLNKFRNEGKTLPMSYFFKKYELSIHRKTCKKVEELITKYSFDLSKYYESEDRFTKRESYLLLQSNFNELIHDIQQINLSKNYLGLMSWLIDRAFLIIPQTRGKTDKIKTTISKNKAILLKTLYEVNSGNLLKCFSKNAIF
jgi:hypothetical protein